MPEYRQLTRLVHPFADALIHKNPSGGGVYVAHPVVTQRLLDVCGPYSFELVRELRGDVPAIPPNPNGKSNRAKNGAPALSQAVVGVVARLRVTVDGEGVVVEDAGDCEDPHNWPHDGARMKDAMSDALKRCAKHVGVGLHLWTKAPGEFYLADKLRKQDEAGS